MRTKSRAVWVLMFLALACCCCAFRAALAQDEFPTLQPARVFRLEQPTPANHGGVFAHDLDRDGRLDFVVTSDGHVGAYAHDGHPLWVRRCAIRLFSSFGLHHPSAIAGDMDGDGREEVAWLADANRIEIVDGATGETKRILPCPGEPRAMAIANLNGAGDREVILQYSQTRLVAMSLESGAVLWETDEYRGIEHSPLRQADLDGDGRDEIAGASIIDHDGRRMNEWDLGGTYLTMDSIVIADVVPGLPLEVVLAEQRGDNSHTVVVAPDRVVFRALNPWNWEDPDKLAVGDFDPARPGLEVFNRSSGGDGTAPRGREEPYANEIAPWVLDATGVLISKYYFNDHKPEWWTGHGLEEICRIDWDGDAADEIAGKERHKNGAGAVVRPITGEFVVVLPARAVRIYVADVEGDSREEVVLIDEDGTVKIFANPAPNPNPPRPSRWEDSAYRRQKQNWNYYSP